jgi:outer membrane lipoprotein-sorting protein
MKRTKSIEKTVREFFMKKKSLIGTNEDLDKRIINDTLPEYEQSLEAQSVSMTPNIWRIIMQSKIFKMTIAAVILLVVILGINYLGTPIDGASTAFAAAMDSIKKARTFSCIESFEVSYKDGEKEGTYLFKQKWMFKEPDLERHEALTSPWEEFKGEITICDYSKRQKLDIKPFDKTAMLYDSSHDYNVDNKTGELQLTQLDTSLRNHLLELSIGTFSDMGNVELDDKSVLELQSEKNGRVTTVWIDPNTNYPVQIEHKWSNQKRSPVLYTSIQIDTELDDELFSLEPPEGYELSIFSGAWPIDKSKLGAKIMHLGMLCLVYANQHDDQFPDNFEDLVTSGVTNENALKNVLAAPDDPNGTPIFRYRKPDLSTLGTDDMSIEVMIYEDYEVKSADEQVVVTMLDSHSELLPVQTLRELLKPWPTYQKKLVNNMTRLHWGCISFAEQHEGNFPNDLSELTSVKFSEDVIKLLLSAPGQQDGPVAIQYVPPRSDTDISAQIVLYESHDEWPADGIVACFADGHCEIIKDQSRLKELIK